MSRAERDTEREKFDSRFPDAAAKKALILEANAPKRIEAHLIPFDKERCPGNGRPVCEDCLRRLQMARDPKYSLTYRREIYATADESGCEFLITAKVSRPAKSSAEAPSSALTLSETGYMGRVGVKS